MLIKKNNNKGESKMKNTTKVKFVKTWDGYNVQVTINGKKYPRARGEWYKPNGSDNRPLDTAQAWARSEHEGRYLARNGRSYENKEAYYKEQENLGYSYVRPDDEKKIHIMGRA